MDWGLEAGRVAEITYDDFPKPGEIARGQGRVVAMLDQPELALLWGGIGAEDFGGDTAWRNFKQHEDKRRDGKHGEKHGDETLAEKQQHRGNPHSSCEPDTVEVVVQARMCRVALHPPGGSGENRTPEGLDDHRIVLQD